ncbi:hypothetical protein GCM10008018_25980 [Paenibacillus marchantiophytorum]|uniref:Spore germination protein n=1 Tax=Paenibacillus marchantiophytorum TaxID=1619310 RepID=A0ABQ1ENB3_9BACL|nr:hypothetical protein [Paenibacillus marchantiophytorum]GFZ79162.1 hypothetical protein GCM10008018_25980 [Paenibacillus marchantiophytorum]
MQKLQLEGNTFSGVGTNNIQISNAQLARIGTYINNVNVPVPTTTAVMTPSGHDDVVDLRQSGI